MNRAQWSLALTSLAGLATGVAGAYVLAAHDEEEEVALLDAEGGQTAVRVALVAKRLSRSDAGEQLLVEAELEQGVADEASLGGVFELLGSHGESIAKTFVPVTRVAAGKRKAFEFATPEKLSDGFYQLRFTASAATAKRSGQQEAYAYLQVEDGSIELLTSDEFYKVSDANLSIDSR